MSMYIPDKYFSPRKCPVCGSMFIMPSMESWAYKRKPGNSMIYFCKYSCLRKWDKEHPIRGGSRGYGDDEP